MAFFKDVPVGHWARKYVDKVSQIGFMVGMTVKEVFGFHPDRSVTRAEMATMLSRMPMTWGDVYDYVADATVWIGRGGHGTGFLFTESGYIVTAKHVVGDGVDYNDLSDWQNVRFKDGTVGVADVVKGHPFADLAILKLRGLPKVSPLMLDDKTVVRPYDDVLVVGHPSNYEWVGQRAMIERVKVGTREYEFDITGGFSGGMSGGAVVNQAGEVLGIIIRSTGDCTSLLNLKKWVEENTR